MAGVGCRRSSRDLYALTDRWRALLASGEAGEMEARVRRHDGEYRWFMFREEPVRDDHGDIVKWYGANTDIDDRKCTEALLAPGFSLRGLLFTFCPPFLHRQR